MSKFKETLKTLDHIKRLYTIEEIFDMHKSGNYNAELLLQHCLINLSVLHEVVSKHLGRATDVNENN